jgi:hypothetical protein
LSSSENELIPQPSQLKQLSSRKIGSLIREGEEELAQLRLNFAGDEEVSYTNADDPIARQMRVIEATLKALKLEAIRRRMLLRVEQSVVHEESASVRRKPLRARDLEVEKRRNAIAQIVKAQGERPSTEIICKKLDTLEIDPPENWRNKNDEIRLWTAAYTDMSLRPLVEKMISDDIAQVRAKNKSR